MAIYGILTLGNEVLREKSVEVKHVDETICRLLDNMKDTMYDSNGVGLAAPQIGVLKRVIIVDIDNHLIELVNPVLLQGSGKQVSNEACLSVPNIEVPVERYKTVLVKGYNRNGKTLQVKASGLLSIALQHEMDHLDGVLIVDRAKE